MPGPARPPSGFPVVGEVRAALERVTAAVAGADAGDALLADAARRLRAAVARAGVLAIDFEDGAARVAGTVVAGDDLAARRWLDPLADAGLRGVVLVDGGGDPLALVRHLAGAGPPPDDPRVFLERDGAGALPLGEALAATLDGVPSAEGVGPGERARRLAALAAAVEPVPLPPASPEGGSLAAELAGFAGGADLDPGHLGRALFEAARAASTDEEVAAVGRAAVREARRRLAAGEPERALEVLRRLLHLLRPGLFEDFPRRPALAEALAGLFAGPVVEAVAEGWSLRPDPDAWVEPMFALGRAATGDHLDELLAFGARLPARCLREAVADAARVAAERSGLGAVDLLARHRGETGALVLLGLRDGDLDGLVDEVAARLDSAVPREREAALVALRRHRSPGVRARILAALEDPVAEVRVEALRHFAAWRDADALPAARRWLAEAPGREACRAIVRGWLRIEPEGAGLCEALRACAVETQLHCVEALSGAGEAGRRVMVRVGRRCPELRERLRALLRREEP